MARPLAVFNNVSLDGFFTDANNELSFGKNPAGDREFEEFVADNSSGDSVLVFGRVTYEMMAGFWPTPQAAQMLPDVAKGMNAKQKIVFSRTLREASWNNTTLISDDAIEALRNLKQEQGPPLVILGSGTLVAQLTQARLIDEYQIMVVPVILGSGRTMFEGVKDPVDLKLTSTRSFANGNVFVTYKT